MKQCEKLRFPKRVNIASVAKKTAVYVVLIALCLTFIIPYLWMIATSLRTEMAYNSTGFTLLPIDEFGKLSFHFENYGEAFKALDPRQICF